MDLQKRFEEFPNYAAARATHDALKARLDEAERDFNAANAQLSDQHGTRKSVVDLKAEAMVAGDELGVIPDEARLHADFNAAYQHLQVKRRAEEIARQNLRQEEAAAGLAIAKSLEPDHRKIVGRIAEIMVELGQAMALEIDFRDACRQAGVPQADNRPMPVAGLGDPRDDNSRFAGWFRDALEHRLIDKAVVPRRWLKKWNFPRF